MTNLEKWCNLFVKFSDLNGIAITEDDIVSDIHELSYDKNNKVYVYNGSTNLDAIDLDEFAQKPYYCKYGECIKDNMINSADAFLVNKDNKWYLIEFKNSKFNSDKSSLKSNVIKKAYSSSYLLLNLLYSLQNEAGCQLTFSYNNPMEFFRNNVEYILVCSDAKNPTIQNRNIENYKSYKKYGYTPEFMKILKNYLFKNASIYTEKYFEKEFVKSFEY